MTYQTMKLGVPENKDKLLFDVVPFPQLEVFIHHRAVDMFRNLVCDPNGMGWITFDGLDYAFCSRCFVLASHHKIPTNWVVAAND